MMNPQFLLAGLWSAGLLALVILADTGRLARWFPWVYRTPEIDKLGHVLLMAGLAWALRRSLPLASAKLAGVLVLLTTLEKISQAFLPSRRADPLDWAGSLLGIALGVWWAGRQGGLHVPNPKPET